MASAAVQSPVSVPNFLPATQRRDIAPAKTEGRNVSAELHYYKDEGHPPPPSIVGRPETYFRPAETRTATIHDVRGREEDYTLDGNGFQYAKHASIEKDFVDDDKVKRDYYPEVEQLLKDTCV